MDIAAAEAKTSPKLLTEFFQTTLSALAEAKNDRLWFKAKMKLGQMYLEAEDFVPLAKILKELELTCQGPDGADDDKKGNELFQVFSLKFPMLTLQKNTKELKKEYVRALKIKSAIPHPLIMGTIRECGGKMHLAEESWNEAYEDFFEAFKNFDESGSHKRINCLKMLVLANMLMKSNVDPFDAQESKPYRENPEIKAMTQLGTWRNRIQVPVPPSFLPSFPPSFHSSFTSFSLCFILPSLSLDAGVGLMVSGIFGDYFVSVRVRVRVRERERERVRVRVHVAYMLTCCTLVACALNVVVVLQLHCNPATLLPRPKINAVQAYQANDIKEFERILRTNRKNLMGDPFVREYIHELLKNIRTEVLIKLIRPYTRIKIPYISKKLNIPSEEVEVLLVGCVLDGTVSGQIDQINQLFYHDRGGASEQRYAAISSWSKQLTTLFGTVTKRIST